MNEAGVIDDLILYRLQPEEFLLVVNAAKINEDRAWIKEHLPAGVDFADQSEETGAIALQGPKALEIARTFLGAGWPEPKRNEITAYSWNCQPILAARTGYTGEDGLELFFPSEAAENFFTALLEAGKPLGLKPCGLGARDTLRLEACLPLNGNDLSPKRTPIEAGLGAFVSLTKAADFPGKEILLKQKANGVNEKLVAFRLKTGRAAAAGALRAFSRRGARGRGDERRAVADLGMRRGAGVRGDGIRRAGHGAGSGSARRARAGRGGQKAVLQARQMTPDFQPYEQHSRRTSLRRLARMDQGRGHTGTVGITDHAQSELSDVVYVELPKVGAKVDGGRGDRDDRIGKSGIGYLFAGERRGHRGEQRAGETSGAGEQGSVWRGVAFQGEVVGAGGSGEAEGRGGV